MGIRHYSGNNILSMVLLVMVCIVLGLASNVASAAPRKPSLRTFKSGDKPSGEWSKFSAWYKLCSESVAENQVILSHKFYLQGDRQCGAWGECRLVDETPRFVCYEFRMQGHEGFPVGNPNNGSRSSEGVLEITVQE